MQTISRMFIHRMWWTGLLLLLCGCNDRSLRTCNLDHMCDGALYSTDPEIEAPFCYKPDWEMQSEHGRLVEVTFSADGVVPTTLHYVRGGAGVCLPRQAQDGIEAMQDFDRSLQIDYRFENEPDGGIQENNDGGIVPLPPRNNLGNRFQPLLMDSLIQIRSTPNVEIMTAGETDIHLHLDPFPIDGGRGGIYRNDLGFIGCTQEFDPTGTSALMRTHLRDLEGREVSGIPTYGVSERMRGPIRADMPLAWTQAFGILFSRTLYSYDNNPDPEVENLVLVIEWLCVPASIYTEEFYAPYVAIGLPHDAQIPSHLCWIPNAVPQLMVCEIIDRRLLEEQLGTVDPVVTFSF